MPAAEGDVLKRTSDLHGGGVLYRLRWCVDGLVYACGCGCVRSRKLGVRVMLL